MSRRLIDADKMIEILKKSHESHAETSREESLLARDIRLIDEQAKYHPIHYITCNECEYSDGYKKGFDDGVKTTKYFETPNKGLQETIRKGLDFPKPDGWNTHKVACLLADLFGDPCACNFCGNDSWLPDVCDFVDTCCPNTVGVACWEQFLKYLDHRERG